ncbi:MAG: ABC-F family ATP-binding cassette domain-containing protein [Lachnospiraceae bacterium]|nr:ABC-F family ATP-binding cassette domain-containing protein [Lachnospiraceae bacterium]
MILSVSGIKKSFLPHEVLKDVSFHLEDKEKMALIGLNGAGKTTLFNILLGKINPDEGSVFLRKDAVVGYLPQVAEYESDNLVEDELLTVFRPLMEMEDRLRRMEQQMQQDASRELLDAYAELTRVFEQKEGYSFRSRVRGVLNGLGFDEKEYTIPICRLSGGQKTRVMLGKLLLQNPDLLLLDEPTNHLDIESLTWLEGYLTGFRGACIIISHDRYFLDRLCTKTMELERGVATVYNGNYSYFIEAKDFRKKIALREYEAQQTEIKRQEAIIRDLRGRGQEKFIKRAQSREKILDKMEVLDKPIEQQKAMRLHFTPAIESGEIVLKATQLRMGFDGRDLFRNMDFQINKGERVALIGANGIGKTTLFKLIMGQLLPLQGDLHKGVNVFPGYYDQTQENLDPSKTVLYEIYDAYPQLNIPQIRNILGCFLFRGDDVLKDIGALSGGEKARVSLCKIMLSNCNFLLLDEPTNHLDIASREVLEQNLCSYEGTLFFISHDRYFINRVATRILELRVDRVVNYLGNYDFFTEHRRIEQEVMAQQRPTENKISFAEQKMAASELRKKKARARKMEDTITRNEEEIDEIKAKMLLPKYYNSASAYKELEQRMQQLDDENLHLMEEWDLLSEELAAYEREAQI